MFRSIVSNLPFSPALVGQLGFYAKRLKKEEATRRIGLVFTVLALVIQSFAVFSPPEAVNAANGSDLIHGGIDSKTELLDVYDASARGNGDLKEIFDYAGITRAELANTHKSTLNSRERGTGSNAWLSWGRESRFSRSHGQVKHEVGSTTVYSRPLWRFDTTSYTSKHGSTYATLEGVSKKMGSFAIIMNCGNLVTTKTPSNPPPPPPAAPMPVSRCTVLQASRLDRTTFQLQAKAHAEQGANIKGYAFTIKDAASKTVYQKTINSSSTVVQTPKIQLEKDGNYSASVAVLTSSGTKTSANCQTALTVAPPAKCPVNPKLSAEDSECQPCAGNDQLWYKDSDCNQQIASSKTATNLTQETDATEVVAAAGDKIRYTVSVYNVGKVPADVEIKEELADVLEYATVHYNGGGKLDNEAKTLSWGTVHLEAGEKESRTFTVAVLDEIPATGTGTSDPSSYNCLMTNAFGNTVNIQVDCPAQKVVVEQVVAELPHTGPTENILFAAAVLSVVTYFYARSRQVNKEIRLIRHNLNAGTI